MLKTILGWDFFIRPSLVVDAETFVPYGYAESKIWNRPLVLKSKFEIGYNNLLIEERSFTNGFKYKKILNRL